LLAVEGYFVCGYMILPLKILSKKNKKTLAFLLKKSFYSLDSQFIIVFKMGLLLSQ